MQNDRSESSGAAESKPASGQAIDYSPKTYTLGEQLVFGAKVLAAGGIFFFVLWLISTYVN